MDAQPALEPLATCAKQQSLLGRRMLTQIRCIPFLQIPITATRSVGEPTQLCSWLGRVAVLERSTQNSLPHWHGSNNGSCERARVSHGRRKEGRQEEINNTVIYGADHLAPEIGGRRLDNIRARPRTLFFSSLIPIQAPLAALLSAPARALNKTCLNWGREIVKSLSLGAAAYFFARLPSGSSLWGVYVPVGVGGKRHPGMLCCL